MSKYVLPQVPKPGETIITVDTCKDDGSYMRSSARVKTGVDELPLYSGILQGITALEQHIRIKQKNQEKESNE